jgi:chorismate mutase-like protein
VRLLLALLASLVVMGLAGTAAAATLERLESTGRVRVATPGDYRPYAIAGPAPETPVGADIALARSLAAHLGVSIEFVATSWPRLADDAAAGAFDVAVGGISITPARKRIASFSRPLSRDGKTALARCERLGSLDELRELDRAEVRVIVNPGGTNEAFARARLPRAALRVHGENLTVFDELVAGRADAMITDAVEARLQQTLHPGVLCAAHPEAPFDRQDKALLLARDGAFERRVAAWQREVAPPRASAALLRRWIDYPWQATDKPAGRLLRLVDARLAVMSDVARYKWNAGAAIEDTARENELLATLVAQSADLGVPAARTERFFRAQFAAARQIQQDLFTLWRRQGRGKLPPAPDLRTDIRPQLDALSAELLRALAATTLPAEGLTGATLTTQLLSPQAERLALEPLLEGTR